jgi:hypothetical protein
MQYKYCCDFEGTIYKNYSSYGNCAKNVGKNYSLVKCKLSELKVIGDGINLCYQTVMELNELKFWEYLEY